MESRCILLIEDQAEIRRMLRNGLESLEKGVRVIELPSGEEALLVLNRQPVDLAIIDIRLAGMTGLDFLHSARRRQRGLKAILITGMTDEKTRRQLAVAEAQACFFKPLEMPAFLEAVEHCLEEGRAGAPLELEIREPEDIPVLVLVEDPPALPSLPVLLEELRLESGASALVLFGSNQDVLGAAGSLPTELDPAALTPPLAGVLSAYARLSACLGRPMPDDLLVFCGAQFDLYLAPIGSRGCLAAFQDRPDSQYSMAVLRKVSQAAAALAPFVPNGSATPPSNGGESQEDGDSGRQGEEAPDFADLFHQVGEPSPDPQALDSFWAQAVLEEQGGNSREGGRLSYEQARDLGLAPDG